MNVARIAADRPVHFEAGGEAVVNLPLAFSPKKLGLAAFRMLTGKGASYGIKGMLKAHSPFGPMDLGVDDAGKTVFRKP